MSHTRDVIVLPSGFRSAEAGLFVAQWDDQSKWLNEDTRGLEPAELEWQAMPGQNTIGMLLAHIALVEVFWTQVGPLGQTMFSFADPLLVDVLGIRGEDDGMPMPKGGAPPAALRGKDLAWYDALLAKAREHSTAAVRGLSDDDLLVVRTRTRRDGQQQEINVRWVLYHMLEHFSGHYGQVNLLRHQYRDAAGR
jgi:uncharacterized damage-inducible protein DinB